MAVLCLAIAVFVTVVSAIDAAPPVLVLAAFWQLVPVLRVRAIRASEPRSDEKTSALLALAGPRPPPLSVALA